MPSLRNSSIRDLLLSLEERKFTSVDLVKVSPSFKRIVHN
jgi:hypothetical protein